MLIFFKNHLFQNTDALYAQMSRDESSSFVYLRGQVASKHLLFTNYCRLQLHVCILQLSSPGLQLLPPPKKLPTYYLRLKTWTALRGRRVCLRAALCCTALSRRPSPEESGLLCFSPLERKQEERSCTEVAPTRLYSQ